jgi:nucleotide-binding universal stress UspA family protein
VEVRARGDRSLALSREGNAAVAEAYRLLSGTGGVVELCLVQDPELHPRAPENWGELQKQLWSLVPAVAEAHGIVTRTSVLEGRPPSEKLLQAADRLGVDALVFGAGHRGGLARALMGSIVDAVISHSSKPVVLVPAPRPDRQARQGSAGIGRDRQGSTGIDRIARRGRSHGAVTRGTLELRPSGDSAR